MLAMLWRHIADAVVFVLHVVTVHKCRTPLASNPRLQQITDADARLYRKGNTASELRFMGHTLSDNRHGLIDSAVVTIADGYAEREAAKVMITDAKQVADEKSQITLGADKGYDTAEFVEALTEMEVLPHLAQNTSNRKSAVPDHIAASLATLYRSKSASSTSRDLVGQSSLARFAR